MKIRQNLSAGMTLVELILYIGIFSLIFSGFIIFTFEFSKTVSVTMEKGESARAGMLIGELARWRVHHAERITLPAEDASSTVLKLEMGEGMPAKTLTSDDIENLFRFESYKKPEGIYFMKEARLTVYFSISKRIYKVEVDLL